MLHEIGRAWAVAASKASVQPMHWRMYRDRFVIALSLCRALGARCREHLAVEICRPAYDSTYIDLTVALRGEFRRQNEGLGRAFSACAWGNTTVAWGQRSPWSPPNNRTLQEYPTPPVALSTILRYTAAMVTAASNEHPQTYRYSWRTWLFPAIVFPLFLVACVWMMVVDPVGTGELFRSGLLGLAGTLYGIIRVLIPLLLPFRIEDGYLIENEGFRRRRIRLADAYIKTQKAGGRTSCSVITAQTKIVFWSSDPGLRPLYDILANRLPLHNRDDANPAPETFQNALGVYRPEMYLRVVWPVAALFFAATAIAFVIYAHGFWWTICLWIPMLCIALLFTWTSLQRYELFEDYLRYHAWPNAPEDVPLDDKATLRLEPNGPVLRREGTDVTISNMVAGYDTLVAALLARLGTDEGTAITFPLNLRPRWWIGAVLWTYSVVFFTVAMLATAYCIAEGNYVTAAVTALLGTAFSVLGLVVFPFRARIDEHGIQMPRFFRMQTIDKNEITSIEIRSAVDDNSITHQALVIHHDNGKETAFSEHRYAISAHTLCRALRRLYHIET